MSSGCASLSNIKVHSLPSRHLFLHWRCVAEILLLDFPEGSLDHPPVYLHDQHLQDATQLPVKSCISIQQADTWDSDIMHLAEQVSAQCWCSSAEIWGNTVMGARRMVIHKGRLGAEVPASTAVMHVATVSGKCTTYRPCSIPRTISSATCAHHHLITPLAQYSSLNDQSNWGREMDVIWYELRQPWWRCSLQASRCHSRRVERGYTVYMIYLAGRVDVD